VAVGHCCWHSDCGGARWLLDCCENLLMIMISTLEWFALVMTGWQHESYELERANEQDADEYK
jgi:hypothetical protein